MSPFPGYVFTRIRRSNASFRVCALSAILMRIFTEGVKWKPADVKKQSALRNIKNLHKQKGLTVCLQYGKKDRTAVSSKVEEFFLQ